MGTVEPERGTPGTPLFAHSANDAGEWHALADHLEATGRLTAAFCEPFAAASLGGWLGRSHDLGKACAAWQAALRTVAGTNRPTGVGHKSHAAHVAGVMPSHLGSLIAAAALLGHHSGMPDRVSTQAGRPDVFSILRDSSLAEPAGDAVAALVKQGFPDLRSEAARVHLPAWLPVTASNPQSVRRVEMFTRMVFSALVDADFLHTEAHFSGSREPRVAPQPDFEQIAAFFSASRAKLLAGSGGTRVSGVREKVFRS